LLSNDLVQKEDISFPGVQGISSPLVFEWLAPLGTVFANLASVGFLLILGAIGVLYLRYRTASNGERKQVRWVLYGGAVAILIAGMPFALGEIGVIAPLGHTTIALVTSLPILLFYGSLVIAVTEPPWVDVDIVIRRSFVYGVLSFLILLLYIAAAAAFGVVAAGASLSIETAVVLTVVVAVLFQPARRRLQLVADRWVFGARPTRYEAVAEFGESIDRSSDPGELLPRLVDTIKKTIRVDWVTAQLDDGTFATSGAVTGNEALVTAIGMGSEEIGLIRCGPKVSGVFDDDERHLIQTFAAQVGLAVMNARLARSVVNAAEAERRRIERNIHDGAQQELVALVARLGMARSNAAKGTLDETVLNELRQEAQHILSDLRDLAQGIHPSVLSDGGILEAVEERCTHLPIDVTLNAAPSLRRKRFHDEVEGASYFFVSETLANVLKHADATKVEVTLGHEGDMIRLDVSDNGRGFEPDGIGQNGLAGLSDRIRALGGTLSISSRLNKGTTIRAELPASER
jgi:signal transduction histidine kinase